MFYGRKDDLKLLNEKWNSQRFEFGCLYGARRIGKTSLINKFIEDKASLYFQAKEASELENRRGLSKLINKRLDYPEDYVFPSWDELFEAVLKCSKGKRFIFVIDEYSYLSKSTKKGIGSYLQDFIDNKAQDSKLFILLLGSNVSFMEKEINDKKSPLYRRRTFSYQLRPLPYSESLLFLEKFDNKEKIDYLSFFGFSPYYLSLLRPDLDFSGNLKNLLFSVGASLLDVSDIILSNGIREKGIYNTILISMARGNVTPSDIARDMELTPNEVSKYLKTLTEENIVERMNIFGSQRKIRYRISDSVLNFYYSYMADDIERIRIGFGDTVYKELENSINDFICHRFEDVCLHYLEELSMTGKLKYPYYPIQNFSIDNSELKRSIEMDGLSRYKDSLLAVECKYTNKKRTVADFIAMKENVSIKMFSNVSDIQFYLFSRSGFDNKLLKLKAENLHLISAEDMLHFACL